MDVLRDNEDCVDDESDSDDADFVPGEAPESDVSEEDVNDNACEGKTANKGKRKKTKKTKGKKLKKNEDDSEDDDLDDEDFSVKLGSKGTEDDEIAKEIDEEAEKKRTDRLWSDFLSGVEELAKKKTTDSNAQELTTKKVYDFAGERVVVEEKVMGPVSNGSSSKEPSNPSASNTNIFPKEPKIVSGNNPRGEIPSSAEPSASTGFPVRKGRISFLSGSPAQIGLLTKPGAKKAGGLSAVLSAIQSNKKQKMGTLEKSRLDWQAFKKDEGIDEELKTHVKSKDGYVDRQEFLHRADLRQFEIEKNLRTRQRRNP